MLNIEVNGIELSDWIAQYAVLCWLQLLLIGLGIILTTIGIILILKKFNDNSHGNVKVLGIEVKGPSKLIILTLGAGLILTGANVKCEKIEKKQIEMEKVYPVNMSKLHRFTLKNGEKVKIHKFDKRPIYLKFLHEKYIRRNENDNRDSEAAVFEISLNEETSIGHPHYLFWKGKLYLEEWEYPNLLLQCEITSVDCCGGSAVDFTLRGDIDNIVVENTASSQQL